MDMILTDRMLLRPVARVDAPDLAALERDAEVMRYLGPTDLPADASAPFLRPRGGEPGIWTARLREGDAFVGWFSLITLDGRPDRAELGYRLGRAFWGQGLATEGARRLLDYGLAQMALSVVEATTMAVNTGSRRVLEKLGFVHVGTEYLEWADPLPGSEHGDVRYELRP